jgi:hypothetical protein
MLIGCHITVERGLLGLTGWLALVLPAVSAELDVAALADRFRRYDTERHGEFGPADTGDSGRLGWSAGSLLQDYAAMWEVTGDSHWLGRIRDQFRRILGHAGDEDGDGFLGWTTKSYSCAVAFAERLHNVSDARIEPQRQQERTGKRAALCQGKNYLIDFPEGPQAYRILEAGTRAVVVPLSPYESGVEIRGIEPFVFRIRGLPHQGDRFLVRTEAPGAIEFAVHQGMFIVPVARFIEAVQSRESLRAEFGADANAFLDFIHRHIFEKHEREWLDRGEQGGGYRFGPEPTDRYPNRILPHNQYSTLARAWLILKDVPAAHPLMAQRGHQMVLHFRSHLEHDAARDAYFWHYWDWIEYGARGSSGYEDTRHARLNVALAVEAARRGVVFTDQDMSRFANTWLAVMRGGDHAAPRMAAFVDGRPPHETPPLLRGWCELSQWNRQVFELALQAFESLDSKQQPAEIPAILLSATRARGSGPSVQDR